MIHDLTILVSTPHINKRPAFHEYFEFLQILLYSHFKQPSKWTHILQNATSNSSWIRALLTVRHYSVEAAINQCQQHRDMYVHIYGLFNGAAGIAQSQQ
jgi:plasmid rolling circle replication initiator protein Rep